MENKAIVNHSELLVRLTELKLEKGVQEISLKYSFTEFVETFDFFSLFQTNPSIKEQTNSLTTMGLNMATNFIIDLILGKNNSVKGYLSAMMVKRFTSQIINNNMIHVLFNIGSMIFQKRNRGNDTK